MTRPSSGHLVSAFWLVVILVAAFIIIYADITIELSK